MSMQDDDRILLVGQDGRSIIVRTGQGTVKVSGMGVVDTHKLKGLAPGQNVEITGKTYVVLRPDLWDHLSGMSRGAQIITPKDGAQIIINCGIVSGTRVLEIGAGSGSLTMMLASAAKPGGRVVSYERETRSAKVVEKNLKASGLEDFVELREDDAANCTDEGEYDVVTTDMPEPWKMLDIIERALKPGGRYCAYVPSMNQVEAVVKALRERNFINIIAQETLLRNIVVGERGTRPDYQMLGHTGYLVFARFLNE